MKRRHRKKAHKGEFAEYGVGIKFRNPKPHIQGFDKDGFELGLDGLILFTEAMECCVGGCYDETGTDFMVFHTEDRYKRVPDHIKGLLKTYLHKNYDWYAVSDDVDLWHGDLDKMEFIEKNTGI